MTDSVPPDRRIDRSTLERVIQRAAELQSRETEIGEGLTEDEVVQLGAEVGISRAYLRQALVEERTRVVTRSPRGLGDWIAGPTSVAAERTVDGDAQHLEEAIAHWMTARELLSVKRRYPDRTAWEPRSGPMATLKRSLGAGGRRYALARAREVVSVVIDLGERRSHVRFQADVSNTRRTHLTGAAGMVITGAGLTAIALTLGVAAPIALVPVPLGGLVGFGVGRAGQTDAERTLTALEQILDGLEHGEIEVPHLPARPPHPLSRIAEEIRRSLGT
ncbi:MAG TPA: hypothetical protein VGA37_08360 [Gemmatimonadales bacterium]